MGRYLTPVTLTEQHLTGQQQESCDRSPLMRSLQSAGSSSVANSIWVKLAALPNPYSHDQAMLLCRHSNDEWLAWIPDQGEAVLHQSEFYFDADWN